MHDNVHDLYSREAAEKPPRSINPILSREAEKSVLSRLSQMIRHLHARHVATWEADARAGLRSDNAGARVAILGCGSRLY